MGYTMTRLLDILASFSTPVVVNGKPVFRQDGKPAYQTLRTIEEIDASIAQGKGVAFLRVGIALADAKDVAANMAKATGHAWAFQPGQDAQGTTKATSPRISVSVVYTGLGAGKY